MLSIPTSILLRYVYEDPGGDATSEQATDYPEEEGWKLDPGPMGTRRKYPQRVG